MCEFPRTTIENLSVSRMIIGTNWFLGYTHTSAAKDNHVKKTMTAARIADVLEVFMKAGVDTLMGVRPEAPHLQDATRDAEDRTGRKCITIGTPVLNVADGPQALDETRCILDEYAAIGVSACLPHQATTDSLVDRRLRRITNMEKYLAMIRRRGMVPGLSTHMPETIGYADETGLDVATYIQIYNAAGFLMQVEVDWVHRIIQEAAKPVIAIKPLAAGRLLPFVGLAFAWATLREQDMIAVGTMTPDEAKEVIELSLAFLEKRSSDVVLQRTRSKRAMTAD